MNKRKERKFIIQALLLIMGVAILIYTYTSKDVKIKDQSSNTSGDYDGDGFQEVYWKTADGTAYLRALMHSDGNIQYSNYQSEAQMSEYLTAQGHESIISDII